MKKQKWIELLVWACVVTTLALAVFAVIDMSKFIHERNDATTTLDTMIDSFAVDIRGLETNAMIDSSAIDRWRIEKIADAKEEADKIKKTPVPYLARVVSGFSGGLLLLLFLYLYKDGKLTLSSETNKEEVIDWSLFWFGLAFMVWSWPTKPQLESYEGWLSANSAAIDLCRSFINSIFLLFAYRDLEVKLIKFPQWLNRKRFNWVISVFSLVLILLFFVVFEYKGDDQKPPGWYIIFEAIFSIALLMLYIWTFAVGIPRRRIVSHRIVSYFIGILSSSGFLAALFYYIKFEIPSVFGIDSEKESLQQILILYYQFSIIISIVFLSFSWSYERESESAKKLTETLKENEEQKKNLKQALKEKYEELEKRKIAEAEKKQAMENEINAKKDALHLFKNALRRIRGLMFDKVTAGVTAENSPLEPYQYVASSVDSLLYFVEGESALIDGAYFNPYIGSVLGKLQDIYRLEHFDYSQALLEKDQYCHPNLLQKFGQVIVEIVQNAHKHGNSSLVLSMELSEAKVMTIRAQDNGGELVYDVNRNSGMRIMRNYLYELDNNFDGNIRKEGSTVIIIFNFHKILQAQ